MEIRPLTAADVEGLKEIDGTIESPRYLHVERAGEGLSVNWRLEERPLRKKIIEPNPLNDDLLFTVKQIVAGAEEGIALVAEHEEAIVALMVAMPRHEANAIELLDLRVDYDFRRQGLATAMIFRLIELSREQAVRAVAARCATNNLPAVQMLAKTGFELTGLDERHKTNHDLVKEAVTLFWYASLT